jgi:hypothetical protein
MIPIRRVGTAIQWGIILLAISPIKPALASTHRLGGGGDIGVSLGRIVAALLICIIVAVLAALFLRQRAGHQDLARLFTRFDLRTRAIEVVETRRLSPHADICLVRHDGKDYLLLLMAGAAQVLSQAPTKAQPQGIDK